MRGINRGKRTWLWMTYLALAIAAPTRGDQPTLQDRPPLRGADGRAIDLQPPRGGVTVLVFYSSECPISNAYSPTLNRLAAEFPASSLKLVGLCVDPDLSDREVAAHATDFALKFPVARDRNRVLAARLGAKVTPEAFVIDAQDRVRYHGRIDDQFAARQQRNSNPRANDLHDAIVAVLAGSAVVPDHVEAVGCPLPAPPRAASPTYSRDVAPILQKSCQECHRRGQVGPFPLETYEQARKRAKDIAAVVEERRMPPWKPDPHVGPKFKNDRSLSQAAIDLILAWADAGAPEGDPAETPPPPPFHDDWTLGTPDLVLELPEDFQVPASGDYIYRCFVIPTDLPRDVAISAIEYLPGNRRVVHHMLTYVDRSGQARKRDAADPGPGYLCFSGPGIEIHGDLGGWAPGIEPSRLPDGIGRILPSKADVVVQIHYHPSGKPETDRSRIGLHFAREPIKRTLHWGLAGNFDFQLPAGQKDIEVKGEWPIPVDVEALSVTPHMHLLGRDILMSVRYPDGRTEDLIKIPDWDFNWQNTYYFEKPIALPKGTVLKVVSHYDNSEDNPRNPNHPPKPVKFGEATTDEMCLGFIALTKKDQDLTRPGEKDDLRTILVRQRAELRKEFEKRARERGSLRKTK
jgi:thiol-disulfide isomerase/thioredoxin